MRRSKKKPKTRQGQGGGSGKEEDRRASAKGDEGEAGKPIDSENHGVGPFRKKCVHKACARWGLGKGKRRVVGMLFQPVRERDAVTKYEVRLR